MNDILSEVKKPLESDHDFLVRRGWGELKGTYFKHGKAGKAGRSSYYATSEQVREDQPLLIARIKELEAERRWIPVSEKLPKKMLNVQVWTSDFGEEFPIAYYDPSWPTFIEWNNGIAGEHISNVTHWKPLPSPPDRAQERGSE